MDAQPSELHNRYLHVGNYGLGDCDKYYMELLVLKAGTHGEAKTAVLNVHFTY